MRILVVAPGPGYSVADVQRGWTRAFERLGHEVRTYNLDDRLSFFGAAQFGDELNTLEPEEVVRLAVEGLGNACYRFWPDMIFVVSGFFITPELWEVWKHRPHKTVLLNTESPYEDDVQFERMCSGEPDLMLLNDPVNLFRFQAYHDHVFYAPHAYDPELHTPGPSVGGYGCDFSFVGTGYGSRVELFSRVDWHGIDMKLAGMWNNVGGTCLERFVVHPLDECFENEDAVHLYRSSKMSANLYRARDGGNEANHEELRNGVAMGPREVELAAIGCFFAREPRPEGDEVLSMLPTFTEPGELEELVRYYTTHDLQREALALRARLAIKDRTFDAHASALLQRLPD